MCFNVISSIISKIQLEIPRINDFTQIFNWALFPITQSRDGDLVSKLKLHYIFLSWLLLSSCLNKRILFENIIKYETTNREVPTLRISSVKIK